jgi:hypothetical protein
MFFLQALHQEDGKQHANLNGFALIGNYVKMAYKKENAKIKNHVLYPQIFLILQELVSRNAKKTGDVNGVNA